MKNENDNAASWKVDVNIDLYELIYTQNLQITRRNYVTLRNGTNSTISTQITDETYQHSKVINA